MSARPFIIGFLIFATLLIPLVQLSFGFQYINYTTCPLEPDIMLLMAIGGVFEILFFAMAFGFVYVVTPAKYKKDKNQTVAQKSAEGNTRASLILIGLLMGILGACAIIFFVLIQYRVYGNFQTGQWANSNATTTYCTFPIYSSAFGLMIATYVAFVFLFVVAIILWCGLCIPKT